MNLETLKKQCREMFPRKKDSEINLYVCYPGGFKNFELRNRNQYEDQSFFGDKRFRTGEFVVIDFVDFDEEG